MLKLKDNVHSVQLMPKQMEFVQSEALQILYSGAVRAGKTRALCYRAARKASIPRAKVGLCRKTMASLKQTTLRTLLEPDGDLPAILPEGSYEHKLMRERISIHGGGEIVYFGCDVPEKIGSLTLSDICIDEAIELDEAEWNMLVTRASLKFTTPDGGENKRTIAVATNPGPPSHFLYRLFFEEEVPPEQRQVIRTSSLENWHLAPDYLESLKYLPYAAKQRYLYGIWAAFEGAIYPEFSRPLHEFHDSGPWDYYLGGVDYGFAHRTAVRVHGVKRTSNGRWRSHVLAEYYRPGITRSELCEMCKDARAAYIGIRFVVDPAAPDIVAELRQHGMMARPAQNDVLPGIRAVGAALSESVDGQPRLSFEPGLKGTEEYMSYSWKESAIHEQPIKKNDDALDADRYAMMELERAGRVGRLLALGGGIKRGPKPKIYPPPDIANERLWRN